LLFVAMLIFTLIVMRALRPRTKLAPAPTSWALARR